MHIQAGLLTYVSNDLHTAFSRLKTSMTDLRHDGTLNDYSGGTVPDSDRIPYSPKGTIIAPLALKRLFYSIEI